MNKDSGEKGKNIKKMRRWLWVYSLLSINLAAFIASLFLLQPVWFDTNRFLSWALGMEFYWVWPILFITFLMAGYAIHISIKLITGSRVGDGFGFELRRIHYIIPFPVFIIWNSMLAFLISELGDEIWLFRTELESATPWIILSAVFLALLFGSVVYKPLGNPRFKIIIWIVLVFSIVYISKDFGSIKITTGPYLQSVDPDTMTISWITNKKATGWVEYGTDDTLSFFAKRYVDGLWDVNDKLHRITLHNLTPDTKYFYRVVSQKIRNLYPSNVEFGDTVKSETFGFETPPENVAEVSFLVINDLHGKRDLLPKLIDIGGKDSSDMVFFNGDTLSHIDTERQIAIQFFDPSTESFATRIPFVFVRGNHEARGKLARQLQRYIERKDGRYYYAFTYGSMRFVILDTGEDKEDGYEEYGGLVNFASYLNEETEWLKNEIDSSDYKTAKYRFVFMHIPPFEDPGEKKAPSDYQTYIESWAKILDKGKPDAVFSGHTHQPKIVLPQESGYSFPVIIGGGSSYKKNQFALVRVRVDKTHIESDLILEDGTVTGHYQSAGR
ncbi:metallophosphoesterase [bacterium]|nr:metallophosphoesterase [bacterium]